METAIPPLTAGNENTFILFAKMNHIDNARMLTICITPTAMPRIII